MGKELLFANKQKLLFLYRDVHLKIVRLKTKL